MVDEFYKVLLKYWRFKVQPRDVTNQDSPEDEPIIEIPDEDGDADDAEVDLTEYLEVIKEENVEEDVMHEDPYMVPTDGVGEPAEVSETAATAEPKQAEPDSVAATREQVAATPKPVALPEPVAIPEPAEAGPVAASKEVVSPPAQAVISGASVPSAPTKALLPCAADKPPVGAKAAFTALSGNDLDERINTLKFLRLHFKFVVVFFGFLALSDDANCISCAKCFGHWPINWIGFLVSVSHWNLTHRRLLAERSISKPAFDNVETQQFEASPIAKSLSAASVVVVDSQDVSSPATADLRRSLSEDFRGANKSPSEPGTVLEKRDL